MFFANDALSYEECATLDYRKAIQFAKSVGWVQGTVHESQRNDLVVYFDPNEGTKFAAIPVRRESAAYGMMMCTSVVQFSRSLGRDIDSILLALRVGGSASGS